MVRGCFLLFFRGPACAPQPQLLLPGSRSHVQHPGKLPQQYLDKRHRLYWVTVGVAVGSPLPLHCFLLSSLRIPCGRQSALVEDVQKTVAPVASFPGSLSTLAGARAGAGFLALLGCPLSEQPPLHRADPSPAAVPGLTPRASS